MKSIVRGVQTRGSAFRLVLAAGLRLSVGLLALGVAVGCAAPVAAGYEPNTAAAQRDVIHRSTPHPSPSADDDDYETSRIEVDFPVPRERLWEYMMNQPLERTLVGTKSIPPVVGATLLTPEWGKVGSRRRVNLGDGSTSLEEILDVDGHDRFRYMVWNFTSDAARAVEYAVGEFRWQSTPKGTHIVWTYRFRSRGWPYSWFLPSFVHNDFHEFMQQTMDKLQTLVAKELG